MAEVIIYTSNFCGYCERAKMLLNNKNQAYTEISLADHPDKIDEMIAKSGRRSVPQIFINGQSIGGFDDLNALNQQGKLDELLKG